MNIRNFAVATILVLSLSGAAHATTLYDDLGGKEGVTKIVENTTNNFLADPRVKATFEETNIDRFKLLLADQICMLSGGPCEYKGRGMAESHKGLNLTNLHFNAVVEDLQKGMDDAGVPFATQNRLLAILAPMQRDIVTK